jgi:DNA-binding IclR family transcriptional regulator
MVRPIIPRRATVLTALSEQTLSVPELAALLDVKRSTMAVLCDTYRRAGYVEVVGNERPMKLRAVLNWAAKIRSTKMGVR